MALTDPVNVQQGAQRRKILLQRLAQQMAARGQRGVNVTGRSTAGNGRSFGNATDLRALGAARLALGFDLPNGRMRPVGFDPNPGPGDGIPGVLPSGPPVGGGGDQAIQGGPVTDMPGDLSAPPQLAGIRPTDGGSANSDTPLITPFASATPPDPYTVMMQRLGMLRAQRAFAPSGGTFNPNFYSPGLQ